MWCILHQCTGVCCPQLHNNPQDVLVIIQALQLLVVVSVLVNMLWSLSHCIFVNVCKLSGCPVSLNTLLNNSFRGCADVYVNVVISAKTCCLLAESTLWTGQWSKCHTYHRGWSDCTFVVYIRVGRRRHQSISSEEHKCFELSDQWCSQ